MKNKILGILLILQPVIWVMVFVLVDRLVRLSNGESFCLMIACIISCVVAMAALSIEIE